MRRTIPSTNHRIKIFLQYKFLDEFLLMKNFLVSRDKFLDFAQNLRKFLRIKKHLGNLTPFRLNVVMLGLIFLKWHHGLFHL